jgi:hypothetical protein
MVDVGHNLRSADWRLKQDIRSATQIEFTEAKY